MTPAHGSRVGRAAPIWLAAALASLLGLVLLTALIMSKVVIPFDQPLLTLALSWASWSALWDAISTIGNYPMIPIGLGFALWLFVKKRRREALLVIILFAAATAGSEGLKALVARPRPEGGGAGIPGVVYSFPSGHSFEDLMILGMIALALWRSAQPRWLQVGFIVLVVIQVVLVCIARVALNVHYPSDMLAGLLGGFAILGMYAWWTRRGAWADHPTRWGP
jgi:membrane-associated phospholipid phosphatase